MYLFILRNYKRLSACIIVFSFFFSVFSAASVSVLMPFVNFIFANGSMITIPLAIPLVPSNKELWLVILCLVTWMIFVLKNTFFVAAQRWTSVMKNDLLQKLREHYLQKTLAQPMNYFYTTPSGYIAARLFDASRQFADKLSTSFYDIARAVPLIVIYAGILVFISWKLTALSLVLVPIISFAGNRFNKILQRSIAAEQHILGRLVLQVQQKIYGIKLVKLFNSEKQELEKFHQQNTELGHVLNARDHLESKGIAVIEMIGVSAGVILLYVIGTETLNGKFSYGPGGFVLFVAAVFSMIDPAKHLIRAVHTIGETKILWNTLHELEASPKKDAAHDVTVNSFNDRIEFSDVSFHFDDRAELLFENLSLTILKGEKIVLAGKSGIGKSTLIDLMLGLMDPEKGSVTLDGIPVQRIRSENMSKLFGVVTQEAFLFHDSIKNNLTYHLSGVTDTDIIEAIRQVELFEWFLKQPLGLDTWIGDRGQTMSGGEKQRLVLARMILRNPDILIFDEATSALDIDAEKNMHEIIFRIFGNKTMLFISHRHTLHAFAERIVEIRRRGISDTKKASSFT